MSSDLYKLPGTQAVVEMQTAMGRKNFLFPGRQVTRTKSSWYFGGKAALDDLFYTHSIQRTLAVQALHAGACKSTAADRKIINWFYRMFCTINISGGVVS